MTCRGLVIAGVHSGVGKTTLTLGLLAALRRRGFAVQPFKVGPDFIDPGHHTLAAGRPSTNLDGWMLSREENLRIFAQRAQGAEVLVVEGVMGLFDGYDGASEAGSTAQMAKWLGLPVLLVIEARALARSAAALIHGFATFDPGLHLLGVVFNRVGSDRHLEYLKEAVAQVNGGRCFGGLRRTAELTIPERHLGLVTAQEAPLSPAFLHHLADLVETDLDLDQLLQALPEIDPAALASPGKPEPARTPSVIRLGVAQDQAFCFYYQENLDYLAAAGAELVYFSPLLDQSLPPDLSGLYLGGGYPEVFAEVLAANQGLRRDLREQAARGLPIYAECGGLMYLSRGLTTLEGKRLPMAGLLPLEVRMLPRLKALGYREVTLQQDCLLGPAGIRARGHEFHYSEISGMDASLPPAYRLRARRRDQDGLEGFCHGNILASYVHLHFGSNPEVAQHFVNFCRQYKERS